MTAIIDSTLRGENAAQRALARIDIDPDAVFPELQRLGPDHAAVRAFCRLVQKRVEGGR